MSKSSRKLRLKAKTRQRLREFLGYVRGEGEDDMALRFTEPTVGAVTGFTSIDLTPLSLAASQAFDLGQVGSLPFTTTTASSSEPTFAQPAIAVTPTTTASPVGVAMDGRIIYSWPDGSWRDTAPYERREPNMREPLNGTVQVTRSNRPPYEVTITYREGSYYGERVVDPYTTMRARGVHSLERELRREVEYLIETVHDHMRSDGVQGQEFSPTEWGRQLGQQLVEGFRGGLQWDRDLRWGQTPARYDYLYGNDKDAADTRARELLFDYLTETQKGDFLSNGYFTVKSQHGNLYRIYAHRNFNIYLMDEHGKKVVNYCTVLNNCPPADQWLSQLLMLQTDEDGFKRIANRQGVEDAEFILGHTPVFTQGRIHWPTPPYTVREHDEQGRMMVRRATEEEVSQARLTF